MKLAILACLVAVAAARPDKLGDQGFQDQGFVNANPNRERDANAQIISYDNQRQDDGGNQLSFETSNDISHQESLQIGTKRVYDDETGQETDVAVPVVDITTSYVDPDGVTHTTRTYQDEDGVLRVESADIPVAPQPLAF